MSPTVGRVFYANDDDRCSSHEAMNKIEEFFFLVTSELQQYLLQNWKGSTISLQDCSIWKGEVHWRDLNIWIAVVAQIQQGPHVKELKCHIDVRSQII